MLLYLLISESGLPAFFISFFNSVPVDLHIVTLTGKPEEDGQQPTVAVSFPTFWNKNPAQWPVQSGWLLSIVLPEVPNYGQT